MGGNICQWLKLCLNFAKEARREDTSQVNWQWKVISVSDSNFVTLSPVLRKYCESIVSIAKENMSQFCKRSKERIHLRIDNRTFWSKQLQPVTKFVKNSSCDIWQHYKKPEYTYVGTYLAQVWSTMFLSQQNKHKRFWGMIFLFLNIKKNKNSPNLSKYWREKLPLI